MASSEIATSVTNLGKRMETNDKTKLVILIRTVKRGLRHTEKVIEGEEAEKIINMLKELSLKKGIEEFIENIGLCEKRNITRWLDDLLNNDPYSIDALKSLEFLVNDFTDNMKTSMREERKHALGFVWNGNVFLAHTIYGSKTVTIELDVIERLIDIDNVLRFVHFYREGRKIKIRFYERHRSESFREWLGLSERAYYYEYKGPFSLISEAHGVEVELRISEKDLYDIIKGTHKGIVITDNMIEFPTPIRSLKIKKIIHGRRVIQDLNELKRKALLYELGVDKLVQKYTYIDFLMKFKPKCTVIDYEDSIQFVGENCDEEILKETGNDKTYAVFADGSRIMLSNEFAETLTSRLLNNEETMIVFLTQSLHKRISLEPYRIRSFKVYHKLPLPRELEGLIEYYNEHGNVNDPLLEYVLATSIMELLANELSKHVEYMPIAYVFNMMGNIIRKRLKEILRRRYRVTTIEDEYIEFKSRDFLVGRNEEIIDRLAKDILKKLKESNIKIYIIGVNESDRSIEPLRRSNFKDERINTIKKGVVKRLEKQGMVVDIIMRPIPVNSNEILLILVVIHKDRNLHKKTAIEALSKMLERNCRSLDIE